MIKITDVPPGDAPLSIRKAWVGVQIPVLDEDKIPKGGIPTKIGTFEIIDTQDDPNAGGYTVLSQEAIRALEIENPEAARWWRNNLSPIQLTLTFAKSVCQIIDEIIDD